MVTKPKATNIFLDDFFSIFHIFPKLRICLFFFVYIRSQKDELKQKLWCHNARFWIFWYSGSSHLLHQMLSQKLFCSYNDKN